MKKTLKINTKVIKSLDPCKDRLANWQKYYGSFDKDILHFLNLDQITAQDKIWVAVRVLPRHLVETFAINCAFSAYAAYTAAYTAYAAYTAAYAAYTAAYAADAAAYAADAAADADATAADAAAREYQVDALIYLIKAERNL